MKCPFQTITTTRHSVVDTWGKHEIIDKVETDFRDCLKYECPYYKYGMNMELQPVDKCLRIQGE